MQNRIVNQQSDIQSVYGVECRAEYRSHSSIFKISVFVCRAECRTHGSIFKVCLVLNVELNIELTARYSRWIFSNAELKVDPIPRYSMCVKRWMQSCTFISYLNFKVCMVLNGELNVDAIAQYSGWMFSNEELNVDLTDRNSKSIGFRMQSWMSVLQLNIQGECFRMHSWLAIPSSIFKLCLGLKSELNVDLIAPCSTWIFSNAELNVEPIVRYFKCVCCWMQSWISIP